MASLPPRLVVAGTHSGVGKTTVATGLLAALRRAGHRVASAKVGPDFIDPGYHAQATGRPGANLDAWICGAPAIAPLAAQAAGDAEVLIVEGVMGLFDGAADPEPRSPNEPPEQPAPAERAMLPDDASTAHVARLLQAPVLLVIDASALAGSVAAVVHGFATLDPRVHVGGVILNRVGSPGHATMLREALAPLGIRVVGALPTDTALRWRERHLGLVPVIEQPETVRASLGRLGALVARHVDLDAVMQLAQTAPERTTDAGTLAPTVPVAGPDAGHALGPVTPRIAVAEGAAFSFGYPENLARLAEAGAELVPFDPLADHRLPEACHGLVAGGGFPEVFAEHLAANQSLLADVARRAASTRDPSPLVIWAECGGLLWLTRSLDGHPLTGVVDATARMTDRLTIGYRRASTRMTTPLGPARTRLRGHEFHRTIVDPPGEALHLTSRFGEAVAGHGGPTMLASYLHLHLGADPLPAQRFVAACALAANRAPRTHRPNQLER